MNKKILLIILIIIAIGLIALMAFFCYKEKAEDQGAPGRNISASEEIQAIEARLEQDKQAAISRIRQKFDKKRVEIEQGQLSAEEKTVALASLDKEMNQELLLAINEINQAADKKIAEIKKRADREAAELANKPSKDSFITEATAGEINQAVSVMKVNQAEIDAARENKQKVEEFLVLENFYNNNRAEAEKLIKEKLEQIKPNIPLPGEYFSVPIE